MRDLSLDAFKGLLVLGMISAHVIQFLAAPNAALNVVSIVINLISFSGFLFAFGYANWFAYLGREPETARPRMLSTAGKTLIAFYASGLAYRLIVEQALPTPALFGRILILSDIPPYSEFLLTFALMTGLAALLFGPLKALLDRPTAFWVVIGLCLISGLFALSVNSPQLGALIGSQRPTTFPVLQYAPWYLLGLWFARRGVKLNTGTAIAALACSGSFVAALLVLRDLPSRFPPSTFWVIGGAALLWAYLWLSRRLTWQPGSLLVSVGANVLMYLLISNLIIFTLKATQIGLALDVPFTLLIAALIMLFCLYLTGIVRPRRAA